MATKEYIIRITAEDKDQSIVKNKVEDLFKTLEKDFEGDIEFYTKIVKLREFGSVLYGHKSDYLTSRL